MTIKSQDELPQDGRDNSTLVEVISKLETTTKQLTMALNGLFEIANNPRAEFNRILYAREIWHKVMELKNGIR